MILFLPEYHSQNSLSLAKLMPGASTSSDGIDRTSSECVALGEVPPSKTLPVTADARVLNQCKYFLKLIF